MIKGITKRWLLRYFSFTIALILAVIFAGSYAVRTYYYEGAKSSLEKSVDEAFRKFSCTEYDFKETDDTALKAFVDEFSRNSDAEAAVIDEKGELRASSPDFDNYRSQSMPDYQQALSADNNRAFWVGSLTSGEKIMAYTVILRDNDSSYVAALRFVESMTQTDSKILFAILVIISICLLLLASVMIPGLLFISTIVKPVSQLRATSRRIAQGDFETRVDKMYDDEIGELADSINHMAEEIKASDRMKNDFISSVSHELRTPLTAIKGWAETMSIGEPDPVTMGKGLSVIINETERLTGMVEELLDFSRIQNGRMVLVMDKIDLLAELDEAVYMLRERAASEKKHFVYDEPENLSPVLGDKNRLRQVFINIIDNALKYTPEGGVIGIQVSEDNEKIKVVISDTGCGIAEKDLPRIKDKFYKANQTVRGSGIGLAVADEIMTLHKGKLEIDSKEDVGTTVTISIPVLDRDDEEILRS